MPPRRKPHGKPPPGTAAGSKEDEDEMPFQPTPGATYYKRLGLTKEATQEEITKAYRKMSLKCHPDRVAEEEKEAATAQFQAINEAHATLKDIQKRLKYDQFLAVGGGLGSERFDPNKEDFDIPWETGPGWAPKAKNAFIVLVLIGTVMLTLGRELWSKWNIHCHQVLHDGLACVGCQSSTLLNLSMFEALAFGFGLWYFDVDEDFYVRMCLGLLCLIVVLGYGVEALAQTGETHMNTFVTFGLLGWWTIYSGEDMVISWFWSSGISLLYFVFLEWSMGPEWWVRPDDPEDTSVTDRKTLVVFGTVIVGALWGLQGFWIWRGLAGLMLGYLGFEKARSPAAEGETKYAGLVLCASALTFYCFAGMGLFWSLPMMAITLLSDYLLALALGGGKAGGAQDNAPLIVCAALAYYVLRDFGYM